MSLLILKLRPVRREVFLDDVTSLKPLGVESSLFLGSSVLFLAILRIAPCLDSAESHLGDDPVTKMQLGWDAFSNSRSKPHFSTSKCPALNFRCSVDYAITFVRGVT